MPYPGELELNRRDLMAGACAAATAVPSATNAQPAPVGTPVINPKTGSATSRALSLPRP